MTDSRTIPVTIDATLARRLVDSQFPQWAHLPVSPVAFGGWDNRTFHLGDRMTIRLPSAAAYSFQVEKEHRWLPRLAPHLPLPIPTPLAMGEPAEGYPWHWSVYEWLDGEQATVERIGNLPEFASTLASFLVALQGIDATGGPPPGAHNFQRGGPLAFYESEARAAIDTLGSTIDGAGARAVLDAALAATWMGAPVWFHGDVAYGNLLVEAGRLRAVIDFGTSGVGDPSCDLAIAWTLFDGESREAFRAGLPLDPGTWARGRGWTIWKGLIVAAAMAGANPRDVAASRRVIEAVIADHRRVT
jgi:aminoglycoside phosphotransferase (APT) family kinase protein